MIKQTMGKFGKCLAIAFLQCLEHQAEATLKVQGYVRYSYQKWDVGGVLDTLGLWLLRMRAPDIKVRYVLSDLVEILTYDHYILDAFETGFGLIQHLTYNRSGV